MLAEALISTIIWLPKSAPCIAWRKDVLNKRIEKSVDKTDSKEAEKETIAIGPFAD